MTKYLLKRLGLAVLAMMIIIVVVYFLVNISPNMPIDSTDFDSIEDYEAEIVRLGLNKSVVQRFFIYIGDLITFQGFGRVYNVEKSGGYTNIPDLFFNPLQYTIWLTLPVFVMSSVLGVSLGILAGYKRGTWVDTIITVSITLFLATPVFLIAAFAIVFGQGLGLPTEFEYPSDVGIAGMLWSMVIPLFIMTLTSLAGYTYFTRNEIIAILKSNQVNIARSKGLSEWEVFYKYVARNSAIPLVSILIPSYITLLTGSLVIESFFNIPGTSAVIVNSVRNAEYNIIMFNTLFFVSLGLVTNIIVDIVYVIIDPRIRYESASSFKFIENIKSERIRKQNLEVKHAK